MLTNLVTDSLDRDADGDIKVYIGEETPVESMKDCSVVTATYELRDGAKGNDWHNRTLSVWIMRKSLRL